MPAIHETAYPYLKRQPSTDELERLYTPTRAECDLAARQTKGPVARIGFLVLLKTFQRLGYFVRLADVPKPIVMHIIVCVDVPLTMADLQTYDTSGTRLRHLAAIRAYRQVQPYDPIARRLLIRGLIEAAHTKTDLVDLINVGVEELIRLRYELPAFAPLCRLARHARAVVHRGMYRQVQTTLTPAVCAQLDQLLIADPDAKTTPWHALKRDPGTPTLTHLKALLDHLAWLTTLPNVQATFAVVPDFKRKHFAAEANSLDVARMAALEPAKRATLLAALLAMRTGQARDDVAEMFVKRMLGIHHKAKEALAAYRAAQQGHTDELIATLRDLVRAYQHPGTPDERLAEIGDAFQRRRRRSWPRVKRISLMPATTITHFCGSATAITARRCSALCVASPSRVLPKTPTFSTRSPFCSLTRAARATGCRCIVRSVPRAACAGCPRAGGACSPNSTPRSHHLGRSTDGTLKSVCSPSCWLNSNRAMSGAMPMLTTGRN